VIDAGQYSQLLRAVPRLARAEAGLAGEMRAKAFFARIPAGRDVFLEGDRVEAIALLLSGDVRVYKIGETGREITLYRFGNGQSCILTANAILSRKSFPAIATVEQEAEAIMIPSESFREWVGRYDLWREFVFDLLSERLSSVMAVVEEVAFRRMDARVATLLADRSRPPAAVRITHQAIARELGTSREVVSRILEDFAARGMIAVGRGTIRVLDREALESRKVG